MVACRILLASVLLSSSPESQPPGDLAAWHEELAPSLRRLALEWQLVDARELGRILTDAKDFPKDLQVLRARRIRLHNAPLLEERERGW